MVFQGFYGKLTSQTTERIRSKNLFILSPLKDLPHHHTAVNFEL